MPHTLMVVHAHPDDEVFSTGGVIARYSASGDRVVVVYATRGEAGEMHHPDIDESQRDRLGLHREEEARASLAILGAADALFLGYRDSGMKDWEENKHPDAFMNAPVDEAADRLFQIVREVRPDVVVTYDESGGYGHPDHVMTHSVTAAAFDKAKDEPWGPKKLYFSARSREGFRRYAEGASQFGLKIPWLREDFNFDEYGVPDAEITAHVDVGHYAPLKKAALAAHRTQIPADFFYLSIPDEALRSYQSVEYFIRAWPAPSSEEREADLFAGLGERKAEPVAS